MANKPIIDIDINDEQFKQFLELYDGFHAKLADLPEEWGKVSKESKAAFNAIGAALLSQNALLAQSLKGQRDLSEESSKAVTSWEKLARHTKDAAGNIVGAAKSLAAWLSVSTVITGLLGVGSLFGIDRLALAVTAGRRSSAGLGVSYGQQQSFGLNFGRFVDPGAVLGSVSAGLFDVTSPEYMALLRAGISPQLLAKGNAADIGAELLAKIPKQFGNVPANQRGLMAGVLGYSQLGIGVEEINRYLNASPEERAKQQRAYREDAQGLGLGKGQQEAWNNLTTQLSRAGKSIENTFVIGLTPLLPGLEKLSKGFSDVVAAFLKSDAVKEWLDKLGEGLKWLGEYMGKPEFKKDVEDFLAALGRLAQGVASVASFFVGLLPAAPPELGGGSGGFGSWRMGRKGGMAYDPAVGADVWQQNPPTPRPPEMPPGFGGPAGNPMFNPIVYRPGGAPGGILDRISYAESRGNPNAVSPKGAMGEFQFMPDTWKEFGAGGDPFNPRDSRAAGGRYLAHLLDEFHGNLREAVAAYNWGPGNVERAVKESGDQWESRLPNETKAYIDKVLGGGPGPVRDQAPRPRPEITINNNTGGSAILSGAQVAI